jgi:hypothetical protein
MINCDEMYCKMHPGNGMEVTEEAGGCNETKWRKGEHEEAIH